MNVGSLYLSMNQSYICSIKYQKVLIIQRIGMESLEKSLSPGNWESDHMFLALKWETFLTHLRRLKLCYWTWTREQFARFTKWEKGGKNGISNAIAI